MLRRRYACVRQADQSDCGPAALATVALHYRVRVGREQLRDLSGTDRVGTTLLGLRKAGERLGFSCRAVKGPYEALANIPLPAIAHTRTAEGAGHYVVLHRVGARRAVVADPARGIERRLPVDLRRPRCAGSRACSRAFGRCCSKRSRARC
jgi:ATP-binding cassette, subfamily C, bacteriocin exporter